MGASLSPDTIHSMTFLQMLQGSPGTTARCCASASTPNPRPLPRRLKGDARPIYDFCARIVDATADLAIAFKPQIAYFAAHRAEAAAGAADASTCAATRPRCP